MSTTISLIRNTCSCPVKVVIKDHQYKSMLEQTIPAGKSISESQWKGGVALKDDTAHLAVQLATLNSPSVAASYYLKKAKGSIIVDGVKSGELVVKMMDGGTIGLGTLDFDIMEDGNDPEIKTEKEKEAA